MLLDFDFSVTATILKGSEIVLLVVRAISWNSCI